MTDEIERAQEYEAHARENAAAQRAVTAPTARESLKECSECGLEIPSARQIAQPGCTLCVDCADWWERVYARQ